jgi:hypothetical protein
MAATKDLGCPIDLDSAVYSRAHGVPLTSLARKFEASFPFRRRSRIEIEPVHTQV